MIARTSRGLLLRALRTLLPLDGALPDGRALPPDIVVLMPTLRCNLHCPYCFQRDESGLAWQPQDEVELSLAEWLAVVDDLKSLGPHVIVIGGELFLYRDAIKLLRAVKRAGLPLTIITNGTALPRVAAELLEIGLDRLIVSLDGPPEVHNAVRGHPRSYQLAAEGIACVLGGRRSAKQPFVQVSCALSVYTQAHLAAFVSAVGPLGVIGLC